MSSRARALPILRVVDALRIEQAESRVVSDRPRRRREPPDPLLRLQRAAGNRAVATFIEGSASRAMPLQRYTITGDYVLGAVAAGDVLFQSQGLDVADRVYKRRRTKAGAGGLSESVEHFDPGAQAWVAQGAPTPTAQPNLRLSQNANFAVPNAGGQSQVAYVEPLEIAAANGRLQGQGATVRLQELSGQLTPTGWTPMRQATAVVDTALQGGVQPGLQTLARTDQRWVNSVCHQFAQNSSPTTGGADEDHDAAGGSGTTASPRPGQKYFFRAGDEDMFAMTRTEFRKVLVKLTTIDGDLATMGLGRSVGEVMRAQGASGLGRIRFLLPGWGDHSESVIARDGSDTLTFANYNRGAELGGVIALYVRQVARAHGAFVDDLAQLRATSANDLTALTGSKKLASSDLRTLAARPQLLAALVNAINVYDAALGQAITDLSQAKSQLQGGLFYFDMYGPQKQSFDTRYKYAGGRGVRGSTTVHGTAS